MRRDPRSYLWDDEQVWHTIADLAALRAVLRGLVDS